MVKKEQYAIINAGKENLIEENGVVYLDYTNELLQTTSENKLIRLIAREHKSLTREVKGTKYKFALLVNLELGKLDNKEEKELANKVLNNGFVLRQDGKVVHSFKLIKLLGGSHHKKIKQFYTKNIIADKLNEEIFVDYMDLSNKEVNVVKMLNSNALTTTNALAIPYNLQDLNICIIPDNELTLNFNNLEGVSKYDYSDFKPEEKELIREKQKFEELREELYELEKELRKKIDNKKVSKIKAEGYNAYKTINRWIEENHRIPTREAMEKKTIKISYSKKEPNDYYIVYEENETVPLEFNKKIFEIVPWNVGYKVDKVNNLQVNNFDGMGLINKKVGTHIRNFIGKKNINGVQLRLKRIKGFFTFVNFNRYFEEKNIEYIYDIFGQKHLTKDIDILATESTFKAKLLIENGKKKWLYNNIEEYKEVLAKDNDNYIEIANFTHSIDPNEYRALTYQFFSSLNIRITELAALASPVGNMIKDVLNVYRKDEVDFEDIKYIQVYLQNIKDQKKVEGNDYIETAIKMLNLNKYMVYDKKFLNYLKSQIERDLTDIGIGRIKVPSNYLYVTGDILAFLKYASCFQNKDFDPSTKIEGYLKEHQFYMSKTSGEHLLIRNPLMSKAELEVGDFVDIEDKDVKYIRHLNNIIQVPINTTLFQTMGGMDLDGDKLHFVKKGIDLKKANLNWLLNYDFIPEGQENNVLDNMNNLLQKDLEKYNSDEVTLIDIVKKNIKNATIQVNSDDKAEGDIDTSFNVENISKFILSSDDKTGQITDINTSVLCRFNDLWDTEKRKNKDEDTVKELNTLRYVNKVMKHFQGLMIDASKSGLTVEIPKIILNTYKNKPYFYKLFKEIKDIDEKASHSTMSRIAATMFKYDDKNKDKLESGLYKWIDNLLTKDVKSKLISTKIYNISALIDNPNIKFDEEKFNELKNLLKKYITKKEALIKEKRSLKKFSKDKEDKKARIEHAKRWTSMQRDILKEAKEICENEEVRANLAVKIGYEDSQHDNSDFAWIISTEEFLRRLEKRQTEKYIVSRDENGEIEYLGKRYSLTVEEAPETIVEEVIQDTTKLNDYTLTICCYKNTSTVEDFKYLEKVKDGEYLESLKLVRNNEYIQINADNKAFLPIPTKCYAKGNLKQRVGQNVTIKEIVKVSSSSVVVKVDIA